MAGTDLMTYQAVVAPGLDVRVCRADLADDASSGTAYPGWGSASRHRGDRVAAWNSPWARMGRYAFLAALADNTAYESALHRWAGQVKFDFSLSPSPKGIFNPFPRLREFWATHLYSGTLDPECGDGKTRPTSVPVEARNDALRPALGSILAASKWDIFQSVYGRLGSGLGDVGLFSVNDVRNRRTYVEVIHPESIVRYDANCLGEGTYYLLREWRDDPRPGAITYADGRPYRVLYVEEGRSDGSRCHFRTFLADLGVPEPYAWDDEQGAEWSEDYPFLPLEMVAHARPLPASPFGESEAHSIVAKILENDDVGTLVNEALRKYVDPLWLFAGVRKPDADALADLEGGPGKLPALYSTDPAARAQALLAAVPFADFAGLIDRYKQEIIDDKPELDRDIKNTSGDASGVALRTYQQRLTTKAQSRRAGYDAGLAAALRRCVEMAGIMGYPGFDDFTPEKVRSDPSRLAFRIADRPLFKMARLDELIVEEKEAAIAESWDRAGFPIEGYAKSAGWSPDRIAALKSSRQDALDKGLPVGRAKQASPPNESAATAIQAPGGAATGA